MKITLEVGDKVKILKGKFAGKEDTVAFIDKKNARARLDKFKKQTVKTKKGPMKDLHGTFHLVNLLSLKAKNEDTSAQGEKAETKEPQAVKA